ncbi:MAG: L,D-transpeptidase [Atopobiaceae bacterium]|nr:L,D-transpeptidase [Atopobiaceae bacterium]
MTTDNTEDKTAVSPHEGGSAMAPSHDWEPSGKPSKRQRRRRVRLAIIGTLAALYAAGAFYFSSHFTPGTTIDGVNASMMDTAQLASAIEERQATYELHITNKDGFDLRIPGSDIGLACDGKAVAEEALSRTSPLLWLPYIISPNNMLIDAHITANEQTYSDIVTNAVNGYNEAAVQPTNATAAFNPDTEKFEMVPETVGTALDTAKVLEASTVATRELKEDLVLGDDALAQPAIDVNDKTLLATIDQANTILDHGVQVAVDDNVVATADRPTMASWMSITDDRELSIAHVVDWVEGNEAILEAGNAVDDEHVWECDAWATAEDIHRVMEQDLGDKAQVIRTAIETKPPVTEGAKERGRHIDINLTTQFVRFYDSDGKVIWDSYCVTGGWDSQYGEMHSTPEGTFAIQAKQTNTTLIGADRDNDEKPDYESFVYFWMPFLNYDYGLHDATWRSDFGGDIREWYGSHGCVNLPYEKAAELFELVNVGDTVYIHY